MGDRPGDESGVGLVEEMESGSVGRAGERALSVKLGAISYQDEDVCEKDIKDRIDTS